MRTCEPESEADRVVVSGVTWSSRGEGVRFGGLLGEAACIIKWYRCLANDRTTQFNGVSSAQSANVSASCLADNLSV